MFEIRLILTRVIYISIKIQYVEISCMIQNLWI